MSRIDWKDITEEDPKEKVLLICKDNYGHNGIPEKIFTGYWNEEENGLTQFLEPGTGYIYSFTHWEYASELN